MIIIKNMHINTVVNAFQTKRIIFLKTDYLFPVFIQGNWQDVSGSGRGMQRSR